MKIEKLPPWVGKPPIRWSAIIVEAILCALCAVLCIAPPSVHAQAVGAQVGVATRFGEFTNNLFGIAPGMTNAAGITNGPLQLTNTQTIVLYTNGGAEVPVNFLTGIGIGVLAGSTNWNNTNVLVLNFDISPFGSTNYTGFYSNGLFTAGAYGAFAGNNTNLIPTNSYGFYTQAGTNLAAAGQPLAYWSWTNTLQGAGTLCAFTNLPPTFFGNARKLRLTSATLTTTGAVAGQGVVGGGLNITNIVWSEYP